MWKWLFEDPYKTKSEKTMKQSLTTGEDGGLFKCDCGHYSSSYTYDLLTTKTLCLSCYSARVK